MNAIGWVKKHRVWLDHPALQSAVRAGIWDKLTLSMARFKCRDPQAGGVDLEAGQLVLVVSARARDWGVTHKQLRGALETFREYGLLQMGTLKGKAGVLISIRNPAAFLAISEGQGQSKGPSNGKGRAKEGQTYKEGEGENLPVPTDASHPSEPGGRAPAAQPPPVAEVVEFPRLANPGLSIFGDGRRYLESCGLSETAARSLLGKWKRDFAPWEVIGALCQAFELGVEHPQSWVEDRLYGHTANRRAGGGETDARRRGIAKALEDLEGRAAAGALDPISREFGR